MRWLTIAVALTALVLVGAGCGGGDDEASGTDTTVITDTLDTDDTTTDETTDETTTDETTEDTDTDVSGIPSAECIAALSAYSAAVAAAATGGDASDSLDALQEFADRAPAEIQDDFQVLAQAYAEYVEVVGDLDLQPGEVPNAEQLQALQQAGAVFSDPEITAANERVSAWAEENCSG